MWLKTDDKRVFGLDIIRAVAILLVVCAHGGFILDGTRLEGFPYFRMIDGVDLFFVLSGFLIGGLLLKEFNKSKGIEIGQLFNFWKRRWFRTLPNYYLILLLNYLVVKYKIINESIDHFNFHFLFFTQNFKTPFYSFFWESWSLSIEEWFYILTPLLIFLLVKISNLKQTFLIATLVMIVFPFLYRYSIHTVQIDSFGWDILFRKTVLCRLDSIGYGLLAAWFFKYYPVIWKKIRLPSFILGILLILFIINFRSEHTTVYKQIIYFSLLPVSVMLLLPQFSNFKSSHGLIPYIIEYISKISYSMYLIHLALVAEIIRDNFTPKGGTDGILKYFVFWFIVILASSLLYKFFEYPIMNLRDKKIKSLWFTKIN